MTVKATASDNVALTKVKLKVGTKLIGACSVVTPSNYSCRWDTRTGKNGLKTAFKICVGVDGVVTSSTVVGPGSGYPEFDARLVASTLAWRYRPYLDDGVPVPVCSVVQYVYEQK